MNSTITFLFGFVLVTPLLWGQVRNQVQSPKALIEEYWRLETSGGRLSVDGWRTAETFCVRPAPIPAHKIIAVIHDNWSVWDPIVKGKKAQVIIGIEEAGQIGPTLSFTPADPRLTKQGIAYSLVFTDHHWVKDKGSEAEREASGPPEWKLEKGGTVIWLTISAAIRYVAEQSRLTKDPIIHKNAAQTLTALERLQYR